MNLGYLLSSDIIYVWEISRDTYVYIYIVCLRQEIDNLSIYIYNSCRSPDEIQQWDTYQLSKSP